MNCSEFNDQLDAYLERALVPALRRDAEAHLAGCPGCRATIDSWRALRANAAGLPRAIAPARDLWPEITAQLATGGTVPRRSGAPWSFWGWLVPSAIAACAAIAAGLFWLRPAAAPGWSVTSLSGTPRVGSEVVSELGTWRVGQWLETDATSRAQFAVGEIGEVELESNSRMRLLGTAPTDHRIELAHGTMHALIWAPPRLFFVETPSATAIDLGCAYTLTVDARGVGVLEVTSGYVALEHGDRSAIIPAGMRCRTHPRMGPGTPFATTASPEFRSALDRFDAGADDDVVVAAIVDRAGASDAVTLWHLFGRVPERLRGIVFDKLSVLAPAPAGVTRAGIVGGDQSMRDRWAFALGLAPLAVD